MAAPTLPAPTLPLARPGELPWNPLTACERSAFLAAQRDALARAYFAWSEHGPMALAWWSELERSTLSHVVSFGDAALASLERAGLIERINVCWRATDRGFRRVAEEREGAAIQHARKVVGEAFAAKIREAMTRANDAEVKLANAQAEDDRARLEVAVARERAACSTCQSHELERAQGRSPFGPPHEPNPRCESGRRAHCSCDRCF